MGKVVFNMSMSLDGFVAGPNDEVDEVFSWYFSGDTDLQFPGAPSPFKVSSASAEHLSAASSQIGAIITGRRTFNLANAWYGNPPLGVHHVVLTHSAPQEWVKPGSPFTFITDGIEHAVAKAREIAGEKQVAVSSADVMRQCLKVGLLDEIAIDLVPVLLGKGVRLFEALGIEPVWLKVQRVVEGTGVTHLSYEVVKEAGDALQAGQDSRAAGTAAAAG